MANPQTENGYTRLSNEILEALAKININGNARRILDIVLRKTYGFHKKQDRISLSQFQEMTLLDRTSVCRAIKKLQNMKLIIIIPSEDGNTYQFQKNNDEWVVAKLPPGSGNSASGKIDKRGSGISAKGVVAKLPHTKETITKDKETKDILRSDLSVAGVEKLMNIFYKINPTLNWGNKTTRKACEDLIKRFGLEETLRMAEAVIAVQGKPYAPVATTPYQMKEKLAQFKIYFDRHNNKSNIIKV